MKNTPASLLALAIFSFGLPTKSSAALTFTNMVLTPTTFSVDIAGTMPGTGPISSPQTLYFANPNLSASPGFVIPPGATFQFSSSFSGGGLLFVASGNSGFGDYFFGLFTAALLANQPLNGTFSATWIPGIFDPNAVSSLEVYWGGGSVTDGVLLGTPSFAAAVIPEPGRALLCGLASVALLARRRRKLSV